MDIILVIITAYFFGKKAEQKGYSSFRYRVRHVSACFFVYTLLSLISYSIKGDIVIAGMTGFVALIGVLFYRYQTLQNMPPANNDNP